MNTGNGTSAWKPAASGGATSTGNATEQKAESIGNGAPQSDVPPSSERRGPAEFARRDGAAGTGPGRDGASGPRTNGESAGNSQTAGAGRGSASGSGGASGSDSGESSASFGMPQRSFEKPNRPEVRRWGIHSRRAAIGFERTVPIQALPDRLIVGRSLVVPVDEGVSASDLADDVARAIDEEAHSWGRPPDSFYWVPSIKFQVSPGGNQHVERLRGPLKQWGLGSSVQYTFDPASTAQPSEVDRGASQEQ